MKNWLFTGLIFLVVSTSFSQRKIKGTITDGTNPIAGAIITNEQTKKTVTTNSKGNFSIDVTTGVGILRIFAKNYDAKKIDFDVTDPNLGAIILTLSPEVEKLNSNTKWKKLLKEVVIKRTVIDIAKDRETPIAVSNIKSSEIQTKLGNQEFSEILAKTPSVYTSKSGGGFGDSRITVRGFSQEGLALMINGIPVNDMEDGSVYWNNWAGLSDVTSSLQIQRGLGSSKLGIFSVGGTINVITRSSSIKKGGTIAVGFGNDNYSKKLVSYSTGEMQNGFSTSLLFCQTGGDGYVDGTKFGGANYFIGFGYKKGKHNFQFTVTGAPQWHNQRLSTPTIAQFIKYGSGGNPNVKYNSDWGNLDGGEYSFRSNYYHKPIMSLNWDYNIGDKMRLSTVIYGSWGRGGGTNGAGGIRGNTFNSDVFRKADGTIDVDLIRGWNNGTQSVVIGGVNYTRERTNNTSFQNSVSTGKSSAGVYDNLSGISKISSLDLNNWYGGIINLNTELSDNFNLNVGVDARTHKGMHYQNISDMLGATNYKDNTDANNQNRLLTTVHSNTQTLNPFFYINKNTEKINYNYNTLVNWYSGFTQLEYTSEKITAFVQGSLSNQGFKREDYFLYPSSSVLSKTATKTMMGTNIKGGINYNINSEHNIFANVGHYSKQPFFDAVYPNRQSVLNEKLVNEKIVGFEFGYGFSSERFKANLNLYHTSWKDRNQRNVDFSSDNVGGYFNVEGITEVHSGIELDFTSIITNKLKVNGMFSIGNWVYQGNVISSRFDQYNRSLSGSTTLYLDGVKVGDAAQTTASLGAVFEIAKGLNIDADYRCADKLYTAIAPVNSDGTSNFTAPIGTALSPNSAINRGALQLPSYGLVDAGISYQFSLQNNKSDALSFRLNINNVFNKIYISEAKTNTFANMTRSEFASDAAYANYVNQGTYNGIHNSNQVFFGFGRTWNFSVTYNF